MTRIQLLREEFEAAFGDQALQSFEPHPVLTVDGRMIYAGLSFKSIDVEWYDRIFFYLEDLSDYEIGRVLPYLIFFLRTNDTANRFEHFNSFAFYGVTSTTTPFGPQSKEFAKALFEFTQQGRTLMIRNLRECLKKMDMSTFCPVTLLGSTFVLVAIEGVEDQLRREARTEEP